MSHVDPNVVTEIINKLEEKFGKMTVTRGKDHNFSGMIINFNKECRNAKIAMQEYLKEAISDSGLNIVKTAPTPTTKELVDVDANAPALPKHRQEVFHSNVAKLLYVST